MPPSSPPPSPAHGRSILGISPRTWLYVAIAFVAGIALFVLIWAKQRNSDDFYRVDGAQQSASGQQFEPLPGPDLEAAGKASEAPSAQQGDTGNARIVETRPTPAPPIAPAPAPQSTPAPTSGTAASSAADAPPVPVSRPLPTYPREALRRGESGEVRLRVHVGVDGVPASIDLVRGSGSRSLDRAATEAVRKWRFNPARRNGQAVEGTVEIPVAFTPPQ